MTLKVGQGQENCQPRLLRIPIINAKFNSKSTRTLAEKKTKWWFSPHRGVRP